MHRTALLLLLALLPAIAHPDPQSERAVRALESSSSVKVRSQAALVLGQIRSAEASAALRRAASADPDAVVRIAVVAALSNLGPAEARPTLEELARADRDESVRTAARAALTQLDAAAGPTPASMAASLAVSLEEAVGGGAPGDRKALRDALDRRLKQAGFQVQGAGGIRLKPSIARIDVERGGERTFVVIRAELVAVEGGGRMAAMLEGRAKLAATGKLGDRELAAVSVQGMDAVAKVLVDDLAARLGER